MSAYKFEKFTSLRLISFSSMLRMFHCSLWASPAVLSVPGSLPRCAQVDSKRTRRNARGDCWERGYRGLNGNGREYNEDYLLKVHANVHQRLK